MIQFAGIFGLNPMETIGDSAKKSGLPPVVNRNVLLDFTTRLNLACAAVRADFSDENISSSSVSGSPEPTETIL
jgi:hypothetical protein